MGIEICLVQRQNPDFGGSRQLCFNSSSIITHHFALILHSQFPELFLTHLEKLLTNTFLIGVL